MPALRDIRRKIEAVKRIGQITKAMNMVASAKLRNLQQRLEGFRPYRKKFEEVIDNVLGAGTINIQKVPFLQQREVKKVGIILMTADKGLCGAFNSNLIRETEKAISRFHKEGKEVELICVGKKGITYFQKRAKVREAYSNIMGKILIQDARKIARSAMMAYLEGEWDEVYVIYGYFINVVRQVPKVEKIIPLSFEKSSEAEEKKVSYAYIYEPEEEELLSEILPLYINTLIFSAMLETAVSEQAARMTAMDNANKACGDMVKQLTLFYNKVRQASITKELMDIVGGAEALKG
ncbi:MAG: FoF1-type ATP synthase [Thermodesulfobacterium sp.]|uniref:ATP synthase gamma chain n=1 Tax=Candidatus Thermodesulfobacterium syntrophicum TaxID=3060442 RepID=A0AAE3P5R7_9BACT|nr:FoF1-type ATP synthase [Candidatus Thermodesulfobacterium syntrophicum]